MKYLKVRCPVCTAEYEESQESVRLEGSYAIPKNNRQPRCGICYQHEKYLDVLELVEDIIIKENKEEK
jgi:transcriptional regulator NrdR family protein